MCVQPRSLDLYTTMYDEFSDEHGQMSCILKPVHNLHHIHDSIRVPVSENDQNCQP